MRYQSILMTLVIAALVACNVQAQFSDDFEAYPAGDPADFSATGNWTHNGLGTAPNASRIFNTVNFGGTRLWIANAANAAAGTGINSRGIAVAPNTNYTFEAALVTETFNGTRTATGTFDLLLGATLGSATSLVGGPQAFTARGDDLDGTTPNNSNSYADQLTTLPFSTGAVGAGDLLFISIAFNGTDTSNPFVGIDDVSIVPEPAALSAVGFTGLIGVFAAVRRRR